MRSRSFFSALLVIVLVLVAIGASGFYWLTSQNPVTLLENRSLGTPSATMFLSRQTPAMVSWRLDLELLEAYEQVVLPPVQRRQAQQEFNQFKRTLSAKTGLNYARDLQPWLGNELTFAVTTTDLDRNTENGLQPGYLLAASIRDVENSQSFVQSFWQRRAFAGKDLRFEQYGGVPIISDQSALSTAAFGDRFVLFANDPKVLREAINSVQVPALNLSSSDWYQEALERLPKERFGIIFSSLPELTTSLSRSPRVNLTESIDGAAAPLEETARSTDKLLAALQLVPQGILAEGLMISTSDAAIAPRQPLLSTPVNALRFIPPTARISASGVNLHQTGAQLLAALPAYPGLRSTLDQALETLKARWGIDLTSDVFSWVDQDYALGLLPGLQPQRSDWVFAARQAQLENSETGSLIQHLNTIAAAKGLSMGSFKLGDEIISVWTKLSPRTVRSDRPGIRREPNFQDVTLDASVQGVYATVEDYVILATSVEAMNAALNSPDSLLTSPEFQQTIAPLHSGNDGYLYLDWQTARSWLDQPPKLRQILSLGEPFIQHVQSLTLSSYGSSNGDRLGGALIQLRGF